jgi:hypothetical protein
MARPQKNTVTYFPLDCEEGKKMFYIEETYGNDGFATFIKILRELARSEYHYLNLSQPTTLMFLSAKCKISKELLERIIQDLVDLGKFNGMLWSENKIIWCQDFTDSIEDAYKKRNNKCISFEGLLLLLEGLGVRKTSKRTLQVPVKPQSKEEESKEEETKGEEKKIAFSFKKELIKYGFNEILVNDWLLVRKTKKASNTQTAYNSFINEIESRECDCNKMLTHCVNNSWSGFKHVWIDNLIKLNDGVTNNKSNTDQGYKPASVDREKLIRELAEDAANGNIPGDYSQSRTSSQTQPS